MLRFGLSVEDNTDGEEFVDGVVLADYGLGFKVGVEV